MELKKNIEYYGTGEICYICLIDEYGQWQGEYIRYNKDGSIFFKGFRKDNFWIGKYYKKSEYFFKSFINLGKHISEPEHKKELAMVRLGLIEEPIQFSYFLKDYDEKWKIK
jgi:hypothetical protein